MVLANCKAEGIKEEELALVLDDYLRKYIGKKNSEAYWERIRLQSLEEQPVPTTQQMKDHFLKTYENRFKREFVLDEYSEPLINLLCMYFTNSPNFERTEENYSLHKGILLHGDVGTGKSSIMSCFRKNPKQSYRVMPCLDVAVEFSKNGYEAMTPFSRGAKNPAAREYWNQSFFSWCFDDLGVDSEKKHFGNESNVMADLIQMVYDSRRLSGKVHFTTNLSADQIKNVYGSRVASRLREMVNIIEFPKGSPDRRK